MKWYLNYKHSQELLIHLLAWVFLFCLPPMLIGRANERPGQEEMFRMMGPPLAMAMVFYLNYIWLVPQLLFNKRNKAYVLSNVAFCIGMLFFTHLWFELVNAYFHSTPPPPKNSMGFWGFLLFRLRDFILFGLIAALAATIRMSKKWHEAELGRQKAELKRIEAELKNLHNQINPHFLYNTFECIRDMALFYDVDDIAELTMALSNVFRFAVKGTDMVTVENELDHIREYAKIINYRFMGKIRIEIDAENAILNCKVFKLLLQPLVENSVFHGLEQKIENGTVWVHVFSPDHATLCFVVEDDGCGIEPERLKQILASLEIEKNTTKIGVFNIYQRLKLYYDDKFSFDIKSSLKKGTCITISIPRESTAEPEGSIL